MRERTEERGAKGGGTARGAKGEDRGAPDGGTANGGTARGAKGAGRRAKGEKREAPDGTTNPDLSRCTSTDTTPNPDCQLPTARRNDLAVLQEILGLRGGQLDDFHPVQPPAALRRFLRTATLGQLQGLLVEVLAKMRDGGSR